MDCNSFKPNEVVSSRYSSWDGSSPGGVLGNHQTVTPRPGVDGTRKKTRFIDFEPRKSGRINTSAGTPTVREVSHHGSVRMRPNLIPVCRDRSTSSDGGSKLQRSGGTIIIASHKGGGEILNWVVRAPWPLNGRLTGRSVVRLKSPVPLTSPGIGEDTTVCSGGLDEGGGRKERKSSREEHLRRLLSR